SGPRKDCGKLRPSIGGAHIDDTYCLDARSRRFNPEQGRGLTTLDAAPELPLRRNNQMLVEGIGMGLDLNPLTASCDHGKYRISSSHDPHVVLELRHIFFRRRFL